MNSLAKRVQKWVKPCHSECDENPLRSIVYCHSRNHGWIRHFTIRCHFCCYFAHFSLHNTPGSSRRHLSMADVHSFVYQSNIQFIYIRVKRHIGTYIYQEVTRIVLRAQVNIEPRFSHTSMNSLAKRVQKWPKSCHSECNENPPRCIDYCHSRNHGWMGHFSIRCHFCCYFALFSSHYTPTSSRFQWQWQTFILLSTNRIYDWYIRVERHIGTDIY